MKVMIDAIHNDIEAIALALVTLEEDDLPVLGEMHNRLNAIEAAGAPLEDKRFAALAKALGAYLERVILRETDDLSPFETGIEYLQAFCRSIRNAVAYPADLAAVMTGLGAPPVEADRSPHFDDPAPAGEEEAPPAPVAAAAAQSDDAFQAPDPRLSEEDLEIFSGFVTESLDGLETVEVSLIDLEQHPDDAESINAIFRSFHTIKGVSGFLGLERINRLAHQSENLLDKIRGNEIDMRPEIIDVILDSVDLLKQLIRGVRQGLDNGRALDAGSDIAPLLGRIDALESDKTGEHKPLGAILVRQGKATAGDVAEAVASQRQSPDKKIGEILVEKGTVSPRQVTRALQEQKRTANRKTDLQIRVETGKLDNLVDLAGELVIAQAMLRQHPYVLAASDQRLVHTLGQLKQITSSLQSMTMNLRMVPIKSTFQKMLRLVRDLARNSGKQVRLTMEGEDTEIDRNMVDELYEPMVHMIRNSVDHGLETPEERRAAGKDPEGEIRLRAYHRGGNIVVEIGDDGRGLDRGRIVEKARTNGIIGDDHKLGDEAIYNLIFQPGFSTAREISDISGRGVGMDVVKKGIEKLRGRVDIQTAPGQGSTFVISLPLTLAIIEGMLVRVGGQRYVLPALSIIESFRPTRKQYSTVEGKGEMILSRDRLIPMVRLGRIFEGADEIEDPCQGLVVVVEYDGNLMCLLLDELLGKEEVVIKNMGAMMKDIPGIAGGAIMGDGRVGLILDMAGIWQLAMA